MNTELKPLHIEIYRAYISGYSRDEIIKTLGIGDSVYAYAIAKAESFIKDGNFDEYAELLPNEDWRFAKHDEEEELPLPTGKIDRMRRNEVDPALIGFENQIVNQIYAEDVVDRYYKNGKHGSLYGDGRRTDHTKLNAVLSREKKFLYKKHVDEMTYEDIAADESISRSRARQITTKAERKLKRFTEMDIRRSVYNKDKAKEKKDYEAFCQSLFE